MTIRTMLETGVDVLKTDCLGRVRPSPTQREAILDEFERKEAATVSSGLVVGGCQLAGTSTKIEDGHTDGEAVGHLIQNDALVGICQIAIDLYSSIDRTGMHDETIWF